MVAVVLHVVMQETTLPFIRETNIRTHCLCTRACASIVNNVTLFPQTKLRFGNTLKLFMKARSTNVINAIIPVHMKVG